MPILSPEERARIEAKEATQRRILESFNARRWHTVHCHLCNWASNGLTFEEAQEKNRRHEEGHPEWQEYITAILTPEEFVAALHDHECVMVFCQCRCGCRRGPFCQTVLGPLCSTCTTREVRDDPKHGEWLHDEGKE